MTDQRKIQHLYWRAGFGLKPNQIREKTTLSIDQAVDQLFRDAERAQQSPIKDNSNYGDISNADHLSMGKELKVAQRKKGRNKVRKLNYQWVKRMTNPSQSPLLERMTLFWHDHFACMPQQPHWAVGYLNALRSNALGNFKEMVLAVSKDSSMIRYLNNKQNRKTSPNENFARELLELFTIGRGNYTERDIKESAKAFTGWSTDFEGNFVFKEKQHDFGNKTFFGKTGKFDGDEIIDIILEKRKTAEYICSKIYHYFVNDQIDKQRVSELTDVFYNSGYDIKKLMMHLFKSDWFYADKHIGNKIKSPIDLITGMANAFNMKFESKDALIFLQKALGQVLFAPPNVAGWPGGKSWIDNSTLMLRLNLAKNLVEQKDFDFKPKDDFKAAGPSKATKKIAVTTNFNLFNQTFNGSDERKLANKLSEYLLQTDINIDKLPLDDFTNNTDKVRSMALLLMSLPEYQMC